MKKALVLLLVLGCAVLVATPAMADACPDADGNTLDFCVDEPNNDALGSGEIVIHITFNSTTNVLDVHLASDGGNFVKGIDKVTFDNDNGVNYFAGGTLPTGWSATDNVAVDGFGSNAAFDSGAAGPGDDQTSLQFTLSGTPTITSQTQFVVHVRYDDPDGSGCSVILSNVPRPGGPAPGDPDCGGTEVPEPGSLALLGTGLFSAVGVLRRKLRKA